MYYQNYDWSTYQRSPKQKKRVRLKRKERMTWMEWFQDWYQALHSQGWTCRNEGVNPGRVRLTEGELGNLDALYMQKGTMAVFLYPSVLAVPKKDIICRGRLSCSEPVERVISVVRGRRPDPQRAVTRVADGTATKIVPSYPVFDSEYYYVDFDRGLFTPTGRGDWQETQDKDSRDLYASYLKASPHFNSFRKYVQTDKDLVPHVTLPDSGSNLGDGTWKPLNSLK